jgi:cytochrome c-type biogenesis protein CcmH
MILFWLICAIMVAIALAFVLPTLLQRVEVTDNDKDTKQEANIEIYRDQLRELEADLANGIVSPEQYASDRDEIERRLLDDVPDVPARPARSKSRRSLDFSGAYLIFAGVVSFILPLFGLQFHMITLLDNSQPAIGMLLMSMGSFLLLTRSNRGAAYGLAVLLPLIAVSLYLSVGNIHALQPVTVAAPSAGMTQQGIEANVAALAKRLEQNPNDADGWSMLGRSYLSLEKYREASDAYARAAAIKSQDADVLVEYAFALAMANGRQLQGPPAELVKRALQIAPENPRALELGGSVEFEAKNYKQAIVYWQKLLSKSANDAELSKTITERINEAKALAAPAAK